MKAGGGWAEIVIHSLRGFRLHADTAQKRTVMPLEDGSLSVWGL